MIKYFILISAAIFFLMPACAVKSEPSVAKIAYTDVCTETNKGKIVAVEGFLNVGNKTPCMMLLTTKGIKRSCAFNFMDTVNITGKEILVYLAEGKENNQSETPDGAQNNVKESKVFARDDIKIHLDDGTIVTPQENIALPVIITGEVNLTGEGSDKICTINASKVQKR